jgi:uncharacterized membrane protein YfcA
MKVVIGLVLLVIAVVGVVAGMGLVAHANPVGWAGVCGGILLLVVAHRVLSGPPAPTTAQPEQE